MNELDFIKDFVNRNQTYVKEKYGNKSSVIVTNKNANPNDLLTEVDLTIQKRFVDAVALDFPGDLVVGEESGLNQIPKGASGRVWVIDPIDGTYNFVRGINPAFAISIAFVLDGEILAACVAMPLQGILFEAEVGKGAFANGLPLHVSKTRLIKEACFEIDFSGIEDRALFINRALEVLKKVGQVRCQGSAAVGICQVATGDVDGYLHMSLSPWDYAAAQLIAEEAGGFSTRLDGAPLRLFDGKEGVLITNGALHKATLALITS